MHGHFGALKPANTKGHVPLKDYIQDSLATANGLNRGTFSHEVCTAGFSSYVQGLTYLRSVDQTSRPLRPSVLGGEGR